jgi:hypothetical protein
MNTVQLNQELAFLSPQHLEEVRLFVAFLLSKQQKSKKSNIKRKQKTAILVGLQPINMPVDNHIIQRNEIYEERF